MRAREEAEYLKTAIKDGTFDNHQSVIGLEYEFYGVSDGRWDDEPTRSLMPVPRRLFTHTGFGPELGLHNAELTTSPQPFNRHGLEHQVAEVRARVQAGLDQTRVDGVRLVSDGIWTVPPTGETARGYLGDSVEVDGVRLSTNLAAKPRYHLLANRPEAPERIHIDAPNVAYETDTVMLGSLITSIQPHYQVPLASELPTFFAYAIRVAGPLLALGGNAPFFPPDLYTTDDADRVLAEAFDEHRISIFESVNNAENAEKARFPPDLGSIDEAVDRIAEDPVFLPMPVNYRSHDFDERFATLLEKHGTFWRWIRPVFDGASRAAANARIEFRPISGQPTIRDSLAFQAAFAGLMESLYTRDHPVYDQEWAVARRNFYAAARDGIDADLEWITNDGRVTTDTEQLYDDLFAHARDGLRSVGLSRGTIDRHLDPLTRRIEDGVTPADWKRAAVRDRCERGASLSEAIRRMQSEYIDRQAETLIEGSFVDWL